MTIQMRIAWGLGSVVIRELCSADRGACAQFLSRVDRHDLRMRFSAMQSCALQFLAGAGGRDTALAAEQEGAGILGIVNIAGLGSGSAEVALIVRSDQQRRGMGRALLTHALRWAEARGVARLLGYVSVENKPMLALARSMGCQLVRWDSYYIEASRLVPARTR